MLGKNSWEEAESELMKEAAAKALEKAALKNTDIRYLVGGDLLGQLIATSFGIADLGIPTIGIYGACSTMGEAMSVGAMLVGRRFCGSRFGDYFKPFCRSGEAVSFSLRLW